MPDICRWKHGVNNHKHLTDILQENKINCLEADVTWNPIIKKPVMRHFPMSLYLSNREFLLQTFIETIVKSKWSNSSKIIKLDFKNLNSLETSIKIIRDLGLQNKVELWLNADILEGPGISPITPINYTKFINCSQSLKNITLSLGWTTGLTFWDKNQKIYTRDMVDKMLEITNQLNQTVKYAVRASLVKNSWNQLHDLVDNNLYSREITVWSGNEGVLPDDIRWMKSQNISNFDIKIKDYKETNTLIEFAQYFNFIQIIVILFTFKFLMKIYCKFPSFKKYIRLIYNGLQE